MSGRAGVGLSFSRCRPATAEAAAAAMLQLLLQALPRISPPAALCPDPYSLCSGDATPSSDGQSTSDRLTVRKRAQYKTDEEEVHMG